MAYVYDDDNVMDVSYSKDGRVVGHRDRLNVVADVLYLY